MTIFTGAPVIHGSGARAPDVSGSGFFGRARNVAASVRRTDVLGGSETLAREVYAQQVAEIAAELGETTPTPESGDFPEVAQEIRALERDMRRAGMRGNEVQRAKAQVYRRAYAARLERLRDKHPDARSLYGEDEIRTRMARRAQSFEARAGEAGIAAQIAGGFAAAPSDPLTYIGLGVGVTSKTILGAFVRGAVVNAALETSVQPGIQSQRDQLGLDAGFAQGAANVLFAAGAGGALEGAGRGLAAAIGAAPSPVPAFQGLRRRAVAAIGRKSDDPELRAGAAEIMRDVEVEADVDAAAGGRVDAKGRAQAKERMAATERVIDAESAGDAPDPEDVRMARGEYPPIEARRIRDDIAVTPRGEETPVTYAIVDIEELVPSHDLAMARNPAFPAELQPRDRGRAASGAQVAQIAASLNPRLLGETASAAEGAPVIRPDGVVLSGNGRTLALMRAYERNMKGADEYRAFLAEAGYPVEDAARPALVRIARDLPDEAAFARDANQRTTAAMSAAEQARADAAEIRVDDLALLDGNGPANARNADFVRRVVERISTEAERGALMDRYGRLSDAGAARVRNAIFAYAYDDAPLIDALLDGGEELASLGKAMIDAAPSWARMRAELDAGLIDPRVDVRAQLTDAAKIVAEARRARRNVAEYVSQSDMFTGETDPRTAAFLRLFFRNDDFTGARARAKIAEELQFYADEARKTSSDEGLFGTDPDDPSRRLIAAAIGRAERDGAAGQSQLFDFGDDAGAPSLVSGAGGGSGEAAPVVARGIEPPQAAFDDPQGPGRAAGDAQAQRIAEDLAGLPEDEALVTGGLDVDQQTKDITAATQTRAELEAEFAEDAAVIERLRGCVT